MESGLLLTFAAFAVQLLILLIGLILSLWRLPLREGLRWLIVIGSIACGVVALTYPVRLILDTGEFFRRAAAIYYILLIGAPLIPIVLWGTLVRGRRNESGV